MTIPPLASLPRSGPHRALPCHPSSPPSSPLCFFTKPLSGKGRTSPSTLTMAPFMPLVPPTMWQLCTLRAQFPRFSHGSSPTASSPMSTKQNSCSSTPLVAAPPTVAPYLPSSPFPTLTIPLSSSAPLPPSTTLAFSSPHPSAWTFTQRHLPTVPAAPSSVLGS